MEPRRGDASVAWQLLLVCLQRGSPCLGQQEHRKFNLDYSRFLSLIACYQHVGIRNQLYDQPLLDDDAEIGFQIAFAEDIVDVGYQGIVDRIREVVGDNPVYITFDIDVIDPAFAPAYAYFLISSGR